MEYDPDSKPESEDKAHKTSKRLSGISKAIGIITRVKYVVTVAFTIFNFLDGLDFTDFSKMAFMFFVVIMLAEKSKIVAKAAEARCQKVVESAMQSIVYLGIAVFIGLAMCAFNYFQDRSHDRMMYSHQPKLTDPRFASYQFLESLNDEIPAIFAFLTLTVILYVGVSHVYSALEEHHKNCSEGLLEDEEQKAPVMQFASQPLPVNAFSY